MKKAKKRNRRAQDLTLINLDALKRRVEALEFWAQQHSILANTLYQRTAIMFGLQEGIKDLELKKKKAGRGGKK